MSRVPRVCAIVMIVALAVLGMPAGPSAQTATFVGATWTSGSAIGFGSQTIGWRFQVNSPITVVKLGYPDLLFGPSIIPFRNFERGQVYSVRLYDASANLLASATVTAASPTTAQVGEAVYHWESVAPVALVPGQQYNLLSTLIAWDPHGQFQSAVFRAGGLTLAPQISFVAGRFDFTGNPFVDSNAFPFFEPGYFGPNMQFEGIACSAPTIHSAIANPSTIWPPTNKMVPVTIAVSSDASDVRIVDVSSNEPAPGQWVVTGTLSVNLQGSRHGSGSGRVYRIVVRATNSCGKSTDRIVTVTVPHDQR